MTSAIPFKAVSAGPVEDAPDGAVPIDIFGVSGGGGGTGPIGPKGGYVDVWYTAVR